MNEWEWQLLEDKTTVDRVVIDGVEVKVGDRVRLALDLLRHHRGVAGRGGRDRAGAAGDAP